MRFALVMALALLIIAMLPTWPYAESWGLGYYPSSILGIILVIVIVIALVGARGRTPRSGPP